MANILMINLPYAGHTNPTLPLAKALVNRGHQVSYVNAEEFRGKIESTGAKFIPYRDYPVNPSAQQQKTRCFRAAFDTALGLDQQFDLLIYEMFFYPGIRIAEKLGIPCVRQFSQPAWNMETIHNATLFFRISCSLIDVQVMGKKNVNHMELKYRSLPEAVIYDRPDLNIVYVPQIFQEKRDSFPDNYLFTMPPFHTAASQQEIPYGRMKRPILYISLGSLISDKGFCKECIRAFGGKDISVILNTGRVAPEKLGNIPGNIHAYSFVPQIEVLGAADAFLTHCGMNSVNEAMAHGVPMIAMPFMNDQISNAKRIVDLGIGKRIRSFPSSSKEMYQTAMNVLEDKRMRERSHEIQSALQAETPFERVVEVVERLMVASRPSNRA